MKKTLRILFLLMLAAGAAKAQFSPYNRIINVDLDTTSTYNYTSQQGSTSLKNSPSNNQFFPYPNSLYTMRALFSAPATADAEFSLTGGVLTMKNATNGVIKSAVYDIQNAAAIAKFSFDLDLSEYTGLGAFIIAFGNAASGSTLISASNPFTSAQVDIFGSFRIIQSGNLVTQYKPANGTGQTNTTPYLIKAGQSQKVEIFVNSTANVAEYIYSDPDNPVNISANTYHIYVDGLKHADNFPKVGTSYVAPAVNALTFTFAAGTAQEKVKISNLSITYPSSTDPTLPVSLTSFNASKAKNSVHLNWQTASEQNNQYFDILRSVNGKDFVSIGTVKGTGTTSEAKSYAFTDYNPVSGYNYYKLKQVDGDGKSTVYDDKVQAVNFGLESQEISAYSLENKLIVKLNSANETLGNITLTTIAGQQVISKNVNVTKGDNEFAIDLGHITKGIYVSKIQLGELSKTVKIAK